MRRFMLMAALATAVVPRIALAQDDFYVAVQGPPGLTVLVKVADATNHVIFSGEGDGVKDEDGDGWYIQRVPAEFVGQAARVCADQMRPVFQGTSDCTKKGKTPVWSADGLLKLRLQ